MKTSYRIGRWLGSQRVVVVLIFLGVLGTLFAVESSKQERAAKAKAEESRLQEEERAAAAAAEAAIAAQLEVDCRSNGAHYKEAQSELKAGRLHEAFAAIDRCRQHLDDPVVQQFYVRTMEAARRDNEQSARRQLAAEKARKKREGVRIGMSQQDVLDSSWGLPQKVNRTTTARGVREQWVYDGGYLYFEDGILTTVQN